MSESDHQAAVVARFKIQYREYSECIWANLNAQSFMSSLPKNKQFRILSFLKKTGMKKGVSDLFIAIPRGGKHGMFIEMKNDTGGKASGEQLKHIELMKKMGYEAVLGHGVDVAMAAIKVYMSQTN